MGKLTCMGVYGNAWVSYEKHMYHGNAWVYVGTDMYGKACVCMRNQYCVGWHLWETKSAHVWETVKYVIGRPW